MSENSYKSARKDVIRAAAVIGTGYLAYKGYKKLSSSSREGGCWEVALGIICLPSIIATLLLFLPYFVFWRIRAHRKAESRLANLEPKLEEASRNLLSRKRLLESLPISEDEIRAQLKPIEKERQHLWERACREASLHIGALEKWHAQLSRYRADLLSNPISLSGDELSHKLILSEEKMANLTDQVNQLVEIYQVQPPSGFFLFDEFLDQHIIPLAITFVVLFIPSLMLLGNK